MFLAIFTLTRGQNSKKSCQTFSVDIRTLKTGYFTVTELNGNNFRFSSMQIFFFALIFPNPPHDSALNVLNGTRACAYRITDLMGYALAALFSG